MKSHAIRSPYDPDLPDTEPAGAPEFGDLSDAVVIDLDWANRRSQRLSFTRVQIRRCRLTGAELAEARLRDVTFDDCRLDLVALRHAHLERVVFRDCRMSECDLYESLLRDVVFDRCELREATFSNCRLERVELRGCDLTALRGAEALRGARMPWNDILANAPLFASVAGIEAVE